MIYCFFVSFEANSGLALSYSMVLKEEYIKVTHQINIIHALLLNKCKSNTTAGKSFIVFEATSGEFARMDVIQLRSKDQPCLWKAKHHGREHTADCREVTGRS